jgi:hypothetical protein
VSEQAPMTRHIGGGGATGVSVGTQLPFWFAVTGRTMKARIRLRPAPIHA